MLSVQRGRSGFIKIHVPSPKTDHLSCFQPAFAMDPGPHCLLSPISLWDMYDTVRNRLLGLSPMDDPPAFQLQSGAPLSGPFMVSYAQDLFRRANIQIRDSNGNVIRVGAASWRAGYVLSAKHAHVSDSTICTNGRWKSLPSSAPYTFESTRSLSVAAQSISSQMYRGGPSATFAGGRFLSDNVLFHGPST
jgi:hypothetical protein